MTIDLKMLFDSEDITNPKMQKTLLEAIKQSTSSDFDYLKFKVSVKKMLEMGMDRDTAIKSAFATASVMGLSKDSLMRSANGYKMSLNKEREKFATALKNKIAKNVDGKKVEAERLKKEIEHNKEKIRKLLNEIEIYEDKISKVDDVVAANKEKINVTRNDFKATFDAIYSQIEEDIINIEHSI